MTASFVQALEPLVPTAVQLLQEAVALNQSEGRGMLAYLVRVLPLLNREARDLWRKELDAMLLLSLCDYLFDSGHRSRYLDGVLPSDPNDPTIWSEPLEPALMPAPQRVIALESIFKNRTTLAASLLRDASNDERSQQSSAALHFELSIVQEHLAFKQHPTYAQYFGTCQRVGCSRPALLAPPESPPEPEPDDAPSEAEYWKCCRDGRAAPPTADIPSDMSFCCYGCYKVRTVHSNSTFLPPSVHIYTLFCRLLRLYVSRPRTSNSSASSSLTSSRLRARRDAGEGRRLGDSSTRR